MFKADGREQLRTEAQFDAADIGEPAAGWPLWCWADAAGCDAAAAVIQAPAIEPRPGPLRACGAAAGADAGTLAPAQHLPLLRSRSRRMCP